MADDQNKNESSANEKSQIDPEEVCVKKENPPVAKSRCKRNVIQVPLRSQFLDHKGNIVEPFE